MPKRIRLDIAYDGTAFHGWAKQPGMRTVQGTLETAITRIIGEDVQLVVAGRTDAGVHATGQVAHLDLTEAHLERMRGSRKSVDISALANRVNGIVGRDADVAVRTSAEAPQGFDARFSPLWRRYEYRIADDRTPTNPLRRHDTTHVLGSLDIDAMDALGATLVGLHDFAAFCKPRPEATTIRTLLSFTWRRDDSGVVIADIAADAFCHSMVRALVGASVAVGLGKLDVDRVLALRNAGQRTSEFKVLAARGLTLVEVAYPPNEELAARAEQTRARRSEVDTSAVR